MLGHSNPQKTEDASTEAGAGADDPLQNIKILEDKLGLVDLSNESTSIDQRRKIISSVREYIHTALSNGERTADIQRALWPHLLKSLMIIKPNLDESFKDSEENAFRAEVLELMARLPVAEVPRSRVPEILRICDMVLNTDSEVNALKIQRFMLEIHRAYKGALEDSAVAYFHWLKKHFQVLPEVIQKQFSTSQEEQKTANLTPAFQSLKITPDAITCSFVLLQAYNRCLAQFAPELIPLLIQIIEVAGPEFSDVGESNMTNYIDFKTLQVKTIAFLVVLARAQHLQQLLQPYSEVLINALLHALRTIPDVLSLRKELIQVMRNILPTPLRSSLQKHLDTLLQEKVILGSSRAAIEALRPIAYTNLAELIASIKNDLTLKQLQDVVGLYSKLVVDVTAPQTLQTTALKLLYNVVEVVFHRRALDETSSEAYRDLLSMILGCMVAKLGSLRYQTPKHIQQLSDLDGARKSRKEKEASISAYHTAAVKEASLKRRTEMSRSVTEQWKKELDESKRRIEEAVTPAEPERSRTMEIDKAENDKTVPITQTPNENAALQGASASEAAVPVKLEPTTEIGNGGPAGDQNAMQDVKETVNSTPELNKMVSSLTYALNMEENAQNIAKQEMEDAKKKALEYGTAIPPFRTLLSRESSVNLKKERDVLDFRSLLPTVLNFIKNILYVTIAWHTPRAIPAPVPSWFKPKPWSSRPQDIRCVANILVYGLPAILFFNNPSSNINMDPRDTLADLFAALDNGRDFAEIFSPRMGIIFDYILSNKWYLRFIQQLLEIDPAPAGRTHVNRYALDCLLRFLINEKLVALENPESEEGKLTLELLKLSFHSLQKIQSADLAKVQALQQSGIPSVERVVLHNLLEFIKYSCHRLETGDSGATVCLEALRALFHAVAPGPTPNARSLFPELQNAVGNSGLHARLVDISLAIMHGPSCKTREAEEAAAEVCLNVPARLEHLIPLLPRMMHAAVRALTGSDRVVEVSLRVLDLWVESFNPEFIERSMMAVMKPMMSALWSHVRPRPYPYGERVAEMLGKMGGRGRRWLGESISIEFKQIPEYGLRVILAFPPHTSFLVPLDRCVHLAWATVDSNSADIERRKNALRLLQICITTLARLQLPSDFMIKTTSKSLGEHKDVIGNASVEPQTQCKDRTEEDESIDGNGKVNKSKDSGIENPVDDKRQDPQLVDDALSRLQALLFGENESLQVPKEFFWPKDLGIKTKKQHAAEKAMLETLLVSVMASAAYDDQLGGTAKEFAHSTCRHFALLLASGWGDAAMPPPAPLSSRISDYGVKGGIPAYVASLKHLQPHILLDSFQEGMKLSVSGQREAVIECMCVFLDTLNEVGEVQLTMQRNKDSKQGEQQSEHNRSSQYDSKLSAFEKKYSVRYLSVQQDLVMRAIHCCYSDSWPARLGGVDALKVLVARIPVQWLLRATTPINKALMSVLRILPDNAIQEQLRVTTLLLNIVKKVLGMGESDGSITYKNDECDTMEFEEETPVSSRRGKRSKRGGNQQPARKKQARSANSPNEDFSVGGTVQSRSKVGDDETAEASRRLQNDLLQLVLSSKSNDAMRSAATRCMEVLADYSGVTIGEMVFNVLGRQIGSDAARSLGQESVARRDADANSRLTTILQRRILPLRSIPTQTNYAYSTAFLLRTCQSQLELSASLATFIADACTILELEDTVIASSLSIRGQPPQLVKIEKLKIACMEVLVAALNWPAFRQEKEMQIVSRTWGQYPTEVKINIRQLRERMVTVFIRRLGSENERITTLATEGVQAAAFHDMLEKKTVLHEGLRPILGDLASYNRVTLPLLRHVHRLLDLLSGQFNVTLGQKMTEHLQKWMEADKWLQSGQLLAWEPGTELDVAASMLNIFHKLPPAAKEFLESKNNRPGIVALGIGLEESISQLPNAFAASKTWSPYRAPIARFLEKYPRESVAYFLASMQRLSKHEYFSLLLDIVRHPIGKGLVDQLKLSTKLFVDILQPSMDEKHADLLSAQFHCIQLLRSITKLSPTWLPKEIFAILLERWRSSEFLERAKSAGSFGQSESKWLAEILINFIRRNQSESAALLDLVSAFAFKSKVDFQFLHDFLSGDVAWEYSVLNKREIIQLFLKKYCAEEISMVNATNIMRFLILPMVRWALDRDQMNVLDENTLKLAIDLSLKMAENDTCERKEFVIELLIFWGLIFDNIPSVLNGNEKKVGDFILRCVNNDLQMKPITLLLLSQFFKAFPGSNDKVLLIVFDEVLRMPPIDSSSRDALRKALDNLLPLIEKVNETPSQPQTFTNELIIAAFGKDCLVEDVSGKNWASYMKKTMSDGLHSQSLLLCFEAIVRNRDLIFPHRDAFIPMMVDVLQHLGALSNVSLESRQLGVDIASTLYYWEASCGSCRKAFDDPSENETNRIGNLNKEMQEKIMAFVIRIAFISYEANNRDEHNVRKLHAHCFDVLRDAARFMPPIALQLSFLEKMLQQSFKNQQNQNQSYSRETSLPLMTGLRLACVLLEHQPDNFLVHCTREFVTMIEPAIHSKHRAPIELLANATKLLFTAYPPSLLEKSLEGAPATAARLQSKIIEIVNKYLNHIAEASVFQDPDFFWYACNCVNVLRAAVQACPQSMQASIFPLLRAMSRFAKEHSQQPKHGRLGPKYGPREEPADTEYSTGAWFMYHALQIAAPSALIMSAEHRRLFLSTLIVLITGQAVRQRQTDPCILFAILKLLHGWLLVPEQQAHLTPKELLVLLQRVAQVDRFEAIHTSLKTRWDAEFLDLLYIVITSKKGDNFGNDVFNRVERTFCCGLQSSDPKYRRKFFGLYSQSVARDLHERLRYIVQYQDWDFLAQTFWLKHAVALLFDCLHMRDPITLAFNSAHVPPLFQYKDSLLFPGALHSSLGAQLNVSGKPEDAAKGGSAPAVSSKLDSSSKGQGSHPTLELTELPEKLRSDLQSHLLFLAKNSALRSDALVSCLIEQVQTDSQVAHHLWVLLFPIVWTSLNKDHQTGLAKPIIALLGKEHHLRQIFLRPTVGQTLLDGISMSQPQPKIPAEMIKYMGRHFHAWHTAITMLESHVGLFPHDMRCFDAVCDLYRALGEDDMWAGLWQRRATCEETRTAVALQQHGYVSDAQSLFLEMMSRGVGGEVKGVTKSEMVLWHDRYLSCCMELNQWETVFEYARSTENGRLELDAAAKIHEWQYLRQVAIPKAQVQDASADITMIKIQLQLAEVNLARLNELCQFAIEQCVMQWWQMPEASPWSYASVLHSLQRAVELSESLRVIMEFSVQGGVGGQYQELKDITDTWKLRTPNEWECVQWWSDILTWRNQVYNMTISQFNQMQSTPSNLVQMGYRDKAWSVNRLAHVAREHHLPEACVAAITTLYGFNAMEVQEAFVKVQEQAKAYMQKSSDYIQGLNLITSTNMNYFTAPHQAEMICLKAQFHQLLRENSKANEAFSEAVQLWPLSRDAWINWGKFCDEQYNEAKQPLMQQRQKDAAQIPDLGQAKKWLEFATSCYIQGVRLSSTEAKSLIPRLLHLLMLDPLGAEVVGNALVLSTSDLPPWVWLPWTSQLVTSLQRPETTTARHILRAAASAYPQHIYWHMRSIIPHLKDAAVRAVAEAKDSASKIIDGGGKTEAQNQPQASSPQIEKPMEMIAYENGKQVVDALMPKQQPALQWLDNLISELGSRFVPRTDERLLAVVHTLQTRTYRFPLPASAPVPEVMQKELTQVCKACGGRDSETNVSKSPNTNLPLWSNWTYYQLEFARDLDPSNKDRAPRTIGEMTERLKGWRTMMEAMIEDMHPHTLRLEDIAPMLAEMPLEEVEMPCSAPPCPDGPETVYIDRISADVEVVRRACASTRRVKFHGSDGKPRYFMICGQQSGGVVAAEERVNNLLRAANHVMSQHPESRRRGLVFSAPRSHALSPAGRIIEDDPSATLYLEAYETYCARYGREPDAPILAFRAATCREDGTMADADIRLKAYSEAEAAVTENVFSQFMYKTMVENSRVMWTFKRQFALSTALSAVACHTLRLTGRAPNKLLISKSRGEILQLEFAPMYNDRLQMELGGETVPFRLTRNMHAFIGPHGFEGTLVAAGVAAAQALQSERQYLMSLLGLFLRDDILAYAQRRLHKRSLASLKLEAKQIEHAVLFNIHHCMIRMSEIGPRDSVSPQYAVPAQGQQQSVVLNPQAGFRKLIDDATNPKNLCMMEATWQPWL